jgi:hypothetical protein
MNIGELIKIFYTYEDDKVHGRPIWQDRGFLGLLVGFLAALLAKYMHVQLDADMQAALIVMIAGAFHLSQPHVGIKKADPPAQDPGHNLTNLS